MVPRDCSIDHWSIVMICNATASGYIVMFVSNSSLAFVFEKKKERIYSYRHRRWLPWWRRHNRDREPVTGRRNPPASVWRERIRAFFQSTIDVTNNTQAQDKKGKKKEISFYVKKREILWNIDRNGTFFLVFLFLLTATLVSRKQRMTIEWWPNQNATLLLASMIYEYASQWWRTLINPQHVCERRYSARHFSSSLAHFHSNLSNNGRRKRPVIDLGPLTIFLINFDEASVEFNINRENIANRFPVGFFQSI